MLVTERHVNIGEVQLSVAEAGAGQRALLMVHGFTGAKESPQSAMRAGSKSSRPRR